ncbi:MAG TPA: hypothetical protein VFL31_04260, partial [Nitrospiraceae bacterium]|nr:hypothetical protein [Nitrospiraceae bacterium]
LDAGSPIVVYRYGADEDNVQVRAVRSEMDWVCRSRGKKLLSILAYPFAIPLDIVSAPVVYVAFQIGMIIEGGVPILVEN